MRTCFFIATKLGTAAAILTSSSNLHIERRAGQEPRLVYNPGGDVSQQIQILLHRLPHVINHNGSNWTIWLAIPIGFEVGPSAIRKLIRARLGSEVIGPFGKPEFQRQFPSIHDLVCPDGCLPHVITGDDPNELGQIDYAPTQEEADNDIGP